MFKRGLVINCTSDHVHVVVRYGRKVSWQIADALQDTVTIRRSFVPALQVNGCTKGMVSVTQSVHAGGSIRISGGSVYAAGRTSFIDTQVPTTIPTVTVTIRRGAALKARNFDGVITAG